MIVLPFTRPWGQGTYPISAEEWSGQPVSWAPPNPYFSPKEGAVAEYANWAIGVTQQACITLAGAVQGTQIEGGTYSALPVAIKTGLLEWDPVYAGWLIAGRDAANNGLVYRTRDIRLHGLAADASAGLGGIGGQMLAFCSNMPRVDSLTLATGGVAGNAYSPYVWRDPASDQAWIAVWDRTSGGSFHDVTNPITPVGSITSPDTSAAIGWVPDYANPSNHRVIASVARNSTGTIYCQQSPFNVGVLPATAAQTFTGHAPGGSMKTQIVNEYVFALWSAKHELYRFDIGTGFTATTITGIPSNGRIIGAAAVADGPPIFAWYDYTNDAFGIRSVSSPNNDFGGVIRPYVQVGAELLVFGGLQPLSFTVVGNTWVLILGGKNKAGASTTQQTICYSNDYGESWVSTPIYVADSTASFQLPVPGTAMPLLSVGPRGLAVAGFKGSVTPTSETKYLYFSPSGGTGDREKF